MTKQLKNAKTKENIYPTLEEGQITERELSEDIKDELNKTIYRYSIYIHCENDEEGFEYRLIFNVDSCYKWYGLELPGDTTEIPFIDAFDVLSAYDVGFDAYNDDIAVIYGIDYEHKKFVVRFIKGDETSEYITDSQGDTHTSCRLTLVNIINWFD